MNTKQTTTTASAQPENVRIKYLDCDPVLIDKPLDWQRRGLQQTATGYGAKLTTSKVVRVDGRTRRVYATCYGNASSAFIILNGQRQYLRT